MHPKYNLLADRLQKKHMMRVALVTCCCSKRWQQFGNMSDTRGNKRELIHQTQATAHTIHLEHTALNHDAIKSLETCLNSIKFRSYYNGTFFKQLLRFVRKFYIYVKHQ